MSAASGPPGAQDAARPPAGERRWWTWLKRALTLAFFAAVAVLLWRYGREIEWREVMDTLRELSPRALALAAAAALPALVLFSSYDLLARRYTGHQLPVHQVVAVNFVSYIFNLNLGALVGGFALRYRLYGRLGLSPGKVSEILAFSVATNWLGWAAVAGAVFLLHPLELPSAWKIDSGALRPIGAALLAVVLGYLGLTAFSRRREWWLRGRRFRLPSWRMAVAQLLMAGAHWLLLAALVTALMPPPLRYVSVLAVLLLAAVAGVIAHVPAGLGVLEAVFIALLSPPMAPAALLAGLLAYRALYYLLPLLFAGALLLLLEFRQRHR